jgi:DNA-nicking Smr family endonuclease
MDVLRCGDAYSTTSRCRSLIHGGVLRTQVAQWLSEDPDLSGAEILRRVRLAGYRGGKSALYELVRLLGVPGRRIIQAEI